MWVDRLGIRGALSQRPRCAINVRYAAARAALGGEAARTAFSACISGSVACFPNTAAIPPKVCTGPSLGPAVTGWCTLSGGPRGGERRHTRWRVTVGGRWIGGCRRHDGGNDDQQRGCYLRLVRRRYALVIWSINSVASGGVPAASQHGGLSRRPAGGVMPRTSYSRA